ncbi:hypothetical protein D3C76_910470 [compost metagenome]
MGRQLFGVQRVTGTPTSLGLEQRRVGIAQQLLGAQGIAGEQADTNTCADEQALLIELEGLLHRINDILRQCCSLADLRALLGEYGKLVATQASQGHAATEQRLETLAHHFEQLITDIVPKAVVDALEMVQVQQQQGTTALVGLGRGQRLFGAVVEQQAVRQVGERIMMGQVGQLALAVLDRADIAEHRHIVAELAAVIADRADGLPLRVHLATLAPVPDLAAPLALFGQGRVDLLIEHRPMPPGLELARALADDLVLFVPGDLHERPVHMHDHPVSISHQHAFKGAVEHRRSHAQTLAVFAAQACADTDEIQQAGSGSEDQQGAAQHPDIGTEQLPAGQLLRIIEKTAQ